MIFAKGMETREIALAAAPEECRLRVERISTPPSLSLRLVEMGVTPGAELSVVRRGYGMVVVRVGGARLALARDVADRVMVK